MRPVGATEETPVDVRIVAATNSDLEEMMERGTVRIRPLLSTGHFHVGGTALARAARRHPVACQTAPVARKCRSGQGCCPNFGADVDDVPDALPLAREYS